MVVELVDQRTEANVSAPVPGAGDRPGGHELECETRIRGRVVRCWLEDGQLCGDPELVERVRRFSHDEPFTDSIDLVHRVTDAVGSDVVIRFR